MAIGTENEAEQTVDLAHLWRSAVEDYEKRTKKSLRLEQISNIDLVMKRTETGFKEFRHDRSKVDKVRTVFRNNMGVIQKVVNAVQMAGSASSLV
ncbi:hypothetical protein Trco_003225 [Trichoderma cornu-damae]|uniref:Fungal STAND N-terminal Goodbye domain-containing protein n=1 Tax=Trichoderma cornu-damae TaxID=654480 RepID=A0A9P8TZV5_9HYPO|nr:hypothetical protein Trco_003225 [Trichoderma cornu-damae]